jgi:4-amino-4-deoxy-L-arabinose transferase-like glycosyltransferase
MTELRKFGLADFLSLVLVLGLALAGRALYLLQWADSSRGEGPIRVQDRSPILTELPSGTEMFRRSSPSETEALIHNLEKHGWFGCLAPFAEKEEQTAHAAPGYPWLVYGMSKIVSRDGLESAMRWLQAALGTVTAALYFFFARRAFRSVAVATVAGVLVAIHPFFIANTAALEDGVVATFLLAVVLLLGSRAAQTGGPFASLLFGLALAGLALVRASLLPFAFVALVWFLLRSRTLARGWLCALLAFLGFANGLAPWTVRNIMTPNIGEPLPVVDSAYYHLWIGNNPEATGGPLTNEMLKTAPAERLSKIENQPKRYNSLGKDVADEVRSRPDETLKRRLRAGMDFVVGEDFVKKGELIEPIDPEKKIETWQRAAFAGMLLGMLAFGFLGWRWSYGWRAEALPAALAMVFVPLPYILSHAEGLHGPRLPLDGMLLTYAGFAICCLLPKIGRNLLDAKVPDEPDVDQLR